MIFDSLLDVPLDEVAADPIAADGDDRLVPGAEGALHEVTFEPIRALALVGEDHLAVPFRGPLHIKMNRRSVRALKRALSRAGYLRWTAFTPYFGPRTRTALRRFQADVHLPVTGVYGKATHAKLARFYDAYAIAHLLDDPISSEQKARNGFLAQLMYLYNRRWSIAYRQTRPFDLRHPPSAEDCSSSGEWAAKWAKLRSLSGYGSWGYGNTDTQIAHLRNKGGRRSSILAAELGDPKFYGYHGDPSHVAYFIGRLGGQARVWSNGHYPIGVYDADYRHDGIDVYDLLAA